MKKIFAFILLIGTLALLMGCCPNSCSAQAQSNPNVVTIDISTLPLDIQETIKQQKEVDAMTQKIQTYGKWAGIGKEIGIATKEGLVAVKDVTIEVADSNLGRTVIWLIVWKVVGKDVIRILAGLLVLLIVTIVVVKSYFRSFSNRVLTTKSGFFLWRKKEYDAFDPDEFWGDSSNRATAQFIHAFIWLGSVGIAFAIAFA